MLWQPATGTWTKGKQHLLRKVGKELQLLLPRYNSLSREVKHFLLKNLTPSVTLHTAKCNNGYKNKQPSFASTSTADLFHHVKTVFPFNILFSKYKCSFPGRGSGLMFNTHLYLTPRLRMGGAIPLRVLHAFMARTQTSLIFLRVMYICKCI